MENENLKPVEKLTPFTRMVMTIGTLPSSFYASMSYYESMVWLYEYLKNQVIPTVNNNAEAVEELQEAFTTLKNYIDNYFDNLDVQKEINKKLDEMAEDGSLTTLISSYLDPKFNEYTLETTQSLNEFKNGINGDLTEFETSINGSITSMTSSISSQQSEISSLSSRMDDFSTLAEGSTTGDAELIDGRTAYTGVTYTNIGGAIRGQAQILLSKINDINDNRIRTNGFDGIYKQGRYNQETGIYDSTNTHYICNKNPISLTNHRIYKITNLPIDITTIYICYYKSDDSFLSATSYLNLAHREVTIPDLASYMYVSMTKGNVYDINPTSYLPFTISFDHFENMEEVNKTSLEINNIPSLDFSNLIYYYSDGHIGYASNRVGTIEMIHLNEDKIISVDNGYKFSYTTFTNFQKFPTLANQIAGSDWNTEPVLISKGTNLIINLATTSDDDINSSIKSHLHISSNIETSTLATNYAIDSNLIKTNITVEEQGTINGFQSFCFYDDKIYSYNNGTLYVQDSSYQTINSYTLNLGHGNSMQIAEDGYCYVSGWDDDKIYKVDLDNISIVDTINLPVSGITTSVVDSVNKIIYILHLNEVPETPQYYDFIKYNYETQTVISSQKTFRKFLALQGMDFYEGKIFINYGFGITAWPNHFMILNTNGDIIGEFEIPSSQGRECEGVFIDKATKEIYIGLNNKIYKIIQTSF